MMNYLRAELVVEALQMANQPTQAQRRHPS